MSRPVNPIHRLVADHDAMARQLVRRMLNPDPGAAHGVAPYHRQAVVVSADATQPPTCTVLFDSVTPGPSVPGIRYAWPLVPVAGDVVYVQLIEGDPWVITRLKVATTPGYLETATPLNTVTTEAINTATYLTVYLEVGRRYRVEGAFRGDSSTTNVIIGRIRYAAGSNPTTSSTLAGIDEGQGLTGAAGARTFKPVGYPSITGSSGNRTFALSTAVAAGSGSTNMAVGNAGVIWLAVTEVV